MNFKQMFCGHDYEIINEVVTKSAFDKLSEACTGRAPITYLMFRRKHITDFKCKKCNHHKRDVIELD
jgi:hypothetical protein